MVGLFAVFFSAGHAHRFVAVAARVVGILVEDAVLRHFESIGEFEVANTEGQGQGADGPVDLTVKRLFFRVVVVNVAAVQQSTVKAQPAELVASEGILVERRIIAAAKTGRPGVVAGAGVGIKRHVPLNIVHAAHIGLFPFLNAITRVLELVREVTGGPLDRSVVAGGETHLERLLAGVAPQIQVVDVEVVGVDPRPVRHQVLVIGIVGINQGAGDRAEVIAGVQRDHAGLHIVRLVDE